MNQSIPEEWFGGMRAPLTEDGFSVRFDTNAEWYIKNFARKYHISRAEVVRILVARSLKELQKPQRVA